MKKSDVLSVLVATALTAAGWKYGGPQWAIPVALGSIILAIAVHVLWKEHTSASTPSPATNKQTLENVGNATATSNPTAIGKYEEHHHHYSVPDAPSVKHIPPTVECVRTRTIRVTLGGQYGGYFMESTIIDSRDPQAVVAYFRNVPSEGTDDHPDIYNVQAQIIYKDSSGNEIQDVPKGTWLNSSGISTHLALNDTEGLILMLLVNGNELCAPYQDQYKRFAIGQVETIDVCLTSHNSGRNRMLLRKTFRWIDEDGNIDAIMLPP